MRLDENANVVLTSHSVSARNDSIVRLLVNRVNLGAGAPTLNRNSETERLNNRADIHSDVTVFSRRCSSKVPAVSRVLSSSGKKRRKGKVSKLKKNDKEVSVCVFDPISEGKCQRHWAFHCIIVGTFAIVIGSRKPPNVARKFEVDSIF